MSAEYIVAHGNPNVILCERGIRTFETATRNTCDIAASPGAQRADPPARDSRSQPCDRKAQPGAGVSRAGVAIGADGLILEVHPCPEKAVSDGAQSLTLAGLPRPDARSRAVYPAVEAGARSGGRGRRIVVLRSACATLQPWTRNTAPGYSRAGRAALHRRRGGFSGIAAAPDYGRPARPAARQQRRRPHVISMRCGAPVSCSCWMAPGPAWIPTTRSLSAAPISITSRISTVL